MSYLTKRTTIFALSVALLILIVYLFLPSYFATKKMALAPKENAEVAKITTQSNDTSLDSIKKDLEATNVSDLDMELNDIQKELDTAN